MRSAAHLLLASWICLASSTAVLAERPVQVYEGAAKIGNLDALTIVYPAGEGRQQEIHRDSALLRASYLSERYGVRASIVTDDEVTAEQLAGHLLVLGWENKLLQTDEVVFPVRRSAAGIEFAGFTGGSVGDDLLWMSVSPFASEKFLVFWSRIDPELDRFLSFPFVGSDWALYRDYFILAQGMFKEATSWPPVRDEMAEHESDFILPPVVLSSRHYVLHHDPGLLSADEGETLLAARESALEQAASLLGRQPREGFKIDLYVYRDARHKHDRTGVADAVHSVASRRELYMARRHAAVANPHEEIHLLAGDLFGSCSLSAMYEGLAFAMEHREREEDLGAYAALLEERSGTPSFEVLFDDERLRRVSRANGTGFATAGLLVHWLDTVGGMDTVARAYGLRRGNAAEELTRILGGEQSAEERFRSWVAATATASKEALAFRKAMSRAVERGQVGDFVGRAKALTEALNLRPGDPELLYRLALSQIEAGLYDPARGNLEQLIERAPEQPDYLVPFSHLQLGRVDELQGRNEAASRRYRRVLELPDVHAAHRRAREALDNLEGTAGR